MRGPVRGCRDQDPHAPGAPRRRGGHGQAGHLPGPGLDLSEDAGIKIHTRLEPLGGAAATVKPAIYPGPAFQEDWRWWGEPPGKTRAIVIDNTPSQANRLEAALELLREQLGLPELQLDLSQVAGLPPHLPRRISGYRFPHRQ